MKHFTSQIDFSLTKKRFKMMSSRISIWRAFPKMLFSVSFLSILTLISSTETRPDTMTPEVHYAIPELHFDGKRSEELGIPLTSGAHFTSSGELFTGTQKVYYTENNSLYMELFYEGGINIGSIMYRDGDVVRQKHTLSNSNHTKEMYVNDVLIYQDIPPSKTEDGMGHFRSWHKNGQLSFEVFYTGDMVRQGLMTEYDEEGNILMQERYEDGELVETIKEREDL